MKKITTIVLIALIQFYSPCGYSQKNPVYNTIETKDVLYYSVEENINMKFGGTTTRYVVSDLSLISTVDLGPNNIRIITPVYKDKNQLKKSYYIETKILEDTPERKEALLKKNEALKTKKVTIADKTNQKNEAQFKNMNPLNAKSLSVSNEPYQVKTKLTEIKIDDKNIEIPENADMNNASLALAIQQLTKSQIPEAGNKDSNNITAANSIDKNIGITENAEMDKAALALAVQQLTTSEMPEAGTKDSNSTTSAKDTKSDNTKKEQIYINVIDTYERVALKGYKSAYLFKLLANSFYFSKQMQKAAKWYGELFAMTSDIESVLYYRYGDALIKTGQTQKGNALVEQFNQFPE